ncbi:hypothetical protein LIER_19480 [Lithospermum erythrorhizon]|uniref:Uncharacterized protein n=1 Tax=Lithospermum erythrorhizon TaxID=34254 RepID=A0AAV3QHY6_LITER
MENLCGELDKSKAEIEKLREECMAKTKIYDSLKTVHARQIAEVGEARSKIERQARELSEKEEEISEVRRLYEDLRADLEQKDSFLRNLSSAQENFRLDFGEMVLKLEGENRDMVGALNEAMCRIQDLEDQVDAANVEISGLKRVVSVNEKKCRVDVEAVDALKERDGIACKLEEETRVAREELKWKTEQFKHLEEAHEKVHDNFQRSMIESEKEKSAMIEEITSLQASLDSQTRISESFQAQLQICHQSLAHEESRRKLLAIELGEFRSRYEDVFLECQDIKSRMEQMTLKRAEEMGELRTLVRTNEAQCKEMKYRATHLEQENVELLASLKELREAQLCGAASTSLQKLKKELTSLQVLHGKCPVNLKEKESNWSSQMEKLEGDLRCSLSEMKEKDEHIKELQKELERFQESFEAQTEEISVLMTVFKSELNPVYSKPFSSAAEEQRIGHCNELNSIHGEFINKKHYECELENCTSVVKKLKEDIEESRKANINHEKELLEIIEEQKTKIANLHDEIGLLYKTITGKTNVTEALKQENEGYKETAKDLNKSVDDLQSEIASMKQELSERDLERLRHAGLQTSFEKEKTELLRIMQEKDQRIQFYQEQAKSQEKNFTHAMTSHTEKQAMLEKVLERSENQKILEMEDKSKIISQLETESRHLRQKLECQGVALLHSEEEVIRLNTLLQATKSEMEDLKNMFENEKLHMDGVMKDLNSHNKAFQDYIINLSDGRGGLIAEMERMSEQLDELCGKDSKLSASMGRMTRFSEIELRLFDTIDGTKIKSPRVSHCSAWST